MPVSVLAKALTNAIHQACKQASKDEVIFQVFGSDLCGACAIASFGLWEKLILEGYWPDLVFGQYHNRDHCWVTLDGCVYDPTHCQFGSPNVFANKALKTFKPCFTNKDAVDYLWLWKEQSPKHYYFEWGNHGKCRLRYHDSLLEISHIV